MKFRAEVESNGKTATGIEVPSKVVEHLGAGKKPKVTVTIGTYSYRSTVASMGGRFLIPVSANGGVSSRASKAPRSPRPAPVVSTQRWTGSGTGAVSVREWCRAPARPAGF